MTIAVTCPCGGRFAAPPHLAGKTVRCPNCQQPLQVPVPPREPLAPIANPFSDTAPPVEAELVPPVAPTTPAFPQSQDPFGGKATVGGPVTGQPQPHGTPSVAPTYAQPHGYAQPQAAQRAQGFGQPRKKSYTLYYVIGAVMFGLLGFVLLVGFVAYLVFEELDGMTFDDSQPLPVQNEDYATARTQFKTTLTSRGEAPQDWDELETPAGAAELIYQSGGRALRAYMDPPPADDEPRPGVVFLHGGFAWGDGDWEMSQPYRDQGFVVMTSVLRGENGQPGHFSLYYDEVDDVLAATSAFAALPYVDETQLYIAGHSAGGTLAALTAMASDRFLAMASFSGSMNLEGVGEWDPDLLVFDDSNERETLMRSPEAFAKSFKCPAQLYYGSEEEWFEEEIKRTEATARSAGLNVQALMVAGDHFTSVRPALMRSIGFFRQQGFASGKPPPLSPATAPRAVPPRPTPDELAPRFPGRRAPDDGNATGRTARPEIPGRPDFSIPDFPHPSIPTPSRPNFPTPTRPSLRTGPSSRHQGILTLEVTGYSGRSPQMFSARRALIRSRWADLIQLEIDEEAGTIKVPVRKNVEIDSEAAKEALENVGFEIGAITFKPIGAEDESETAEEPGE